MCRIKLTDSKDFNGSVKEILDKLLVHIDIRSDNVVLIHDNDDTGDSCGTGIDIVNVELDGTSWSHLRRLMRPYYHSSVVIIQTPYIMGTSANFQSFLNKITANIMVVMVEDPCCDDGYVSSCLFLKEWSNKAHGGVHMYYQSKPLVHNPPDKGNLIMFCHDDETTGIQNAVSPGILSPGILSPSVPLSLSSLSPLLPLPLYTAVTPYTYAAAAATISEPFTGNVGIVEHSPLIELLNNIADTAQIAPTTENNPSQVHTIIDIMLEDTDTSSEISGTCEIGEIDNIENVD